MNASLYFLWVGIVPIRQSLYILKNGVVIGFLLFSEHGLYFSQPFYGRLCHHGPLFRCLPQPLYGYGKIWFYSVPMEIAVP